MLRPGKIEQLEGEKAWVRMKKGTGCSGNHHCPLSSTILDDSGTDFYKILAKNEISAPIGANVLVEIKDNMALKISFFIYLLPIILVLGAYLLAHVLTSNRFLEGFATIGAVLIAIIVLKRVDRTLEPNFSITGYFQDEDCSQCPFINKKEK